MSKATFTAGSTPTSAAPWVIANHLSCMCCFVAGESGGAVAASGPTGFSCTDCQSQDNTAAQQGGWVYCSGCTTTAITAGNSSNNTAGAAGGSVSCTDCTSFATREYQYSSNKASSGGAVAVQTAVDVSVSGCSMVDNTAGNATRDPVISPLVHQLYQLPAAWQNMYGAGQATASLGCGAEGAGGGLCLSGAGAADIADTTLTSNRGSTGGALFASANCNANETGCRSNQVNVTNLVARHNFATDAGGALYTTTPQAVMVGTAGEDPESPAAKKPSAGIVQQLSEDNAVDGNGYGPGLASFPSELSLMWPIQKGMSTSQPDTAAAAAAPLPTQQPGRSGRKLQQLPLPPNAAGIALGSTIKDFQRQVDSVHHMTSSAGRSTSEWAMSVLLRRFDTYRRAQLHLDDWGMMIPQCSLHLVVLRLLGVPCSHEDSIQCK